MRVAIASVVVEIDRAAYFGHFAVEYLESNVQYPQTQARYYRI